MTSCWVIVLPPSTTVPALRLLKSARAMPRASMPGLQLVNLGRCYSGEGAAAHAMYLLNGTPVSLYIIPGADRGRAAADVFGYDALVWSRANTTYVLVSSESRQTLERVAAVMQGGN